MAQLGADVEHLDGLARRFNEVAEQIDQLVGQLGGQIQGAWWIGTDADRFRSDWDGQFRPQLQNVCTRLRDTAQQVTQQASQQRQTSQA